jgi:hypothetical protein
MESVQSTVEAYPPHYTTSHFRDQPSASPCCVTNHVIGQGHSTEMKASGPGDVLRGLDCRMHHGAMAD